MQVVSMAAQRGQVSTLRYQHAVHYARATYTQCHVVRLLLQYKLDAVCCLLGSTGKATLGQGFALCHTLVRRCARLTRLCDVATFNTSFSLSSCCSRCCSSVMSALSSARASVSFCSLVLATSVSLVASEATLLASDNLSISSSASACRACSSSCDLCCKMRDCVSDGAAATSAIPK